MYTEKEEKTPVPVEFHGKTGEWFGIWIVNLVLSILTIGIYSAWAKVRTKKYFYQHTYVGGRNFDYHATGKQILIGRLIVIAGLVVYGVLSAIPILALIGFVVLLFLIPWLAVRSLMFDARMSSWSNVRFGFHGTYGGAAKALILFPILAVLTLYTTAPFADRARRRFVVDNHTLGKAPFAFDAPISKFYKAFLAFLAWIVIGAVLMGAVLMATGLFETLAMAFAGTMDPSAMDDPAMMDPMAQVLPILIFYAAIIVLFAPAGALYYAMTRNIVFNHSTLGGVHAFRSTVPPLRYVWIVLSNAVAIVCTLGLALPWAHIRKSRFLAAHTTALVGGSLDDFVGDIKTDGGAVGDAYGDIEGLGLDIGV